MTAELAEPWRAGLAFVESGSVALATLRPSDGQDVTAVRARLLAEHRDGFARPEPGS